MKHEPRSDRHLNPAALSDRELERLFPGESELAVRMRAIDWSQTRLGAFSDWPASLKTAVSICLNSRFPMVIWWGKELVLLYNDAWRPILGSKHPKALGRPGQEVWAEIWDIIGAQLNSVLATAQATWSDDMLLLVDRHGYTEEAYFTYSYSPIFLETGEVGGAFTAVTETTRRVIGERQLSTLRELAASTVEAKSVEETCQIATATLANNPYDIPFALLYLVEHNGQQARLVGTVRIEAGTPASPEQVDLTQAADCWQLATAQRTGKAEMIEDLTPRLGRLTGGAWDQPSRSAVVLPIAQSGQKHQLSGLLVLGISPRRAFDDEYQGFFDLVANHVATAIANAQAYEEERRRAEALAEIDRAKTVFFSNVSHEFRTPLTLMLAPAEDALRDLDDPLSANQTARIEAVQRNGQRLLKLVNTLLDFSRIEAGRVQASYQPTDLAAFTTELASVFRSAIERANLRLVVNCPPLPEAVYVDREMWEKIVFNLLSNALKFTFAGEISVGLIWVNDQIELTVQDTGIGIPAAELPRLFERFHRVEGAQGRSVEGSGIGLSLVQELVKLHQGAIAVTSLENEGTCFKVSLPTGTAHLPPDQVEASRALASTASSANAFLAEALRWLPERQDAAAFRLEEQSWPARYSELFPSAKLVLADDNADMRDYVQRLLSQYYQVVAVSDGITALAAVRQQRPDLVLTDVMMPNLDGFGLLQALRADPQTREIPMILLSARAGEEARIEGLAAGADDYLTKPFSGRELLARVEATLKLTQLRREATQREQALRLEAEAAKQQVETILSSIRDGFYVLDRDWNFTYVNDRYCTIVDRERATLLGQNLRELFPDLAGEEVYLHFNQALREQTSVQFEWLSPTWNRWFEYRVYPSQPGLTVFLSEITDRKQAEAERERLLQQEQALRSAAESTEAKLQELLASIREDFVLFDRQWQIVYLNSQAASTMRQDRQTLLGKNFWQLFPDLVGTEFCDRLHQVMRDQIPIQFEYYYATWDQWFENRVYPTPDGVVNLCTNITARKRAELHEQFLSQLDIELRQLANPDQMLWEAVSRIGAYLKVDRCLWHQVDGQQASVDQCWRRSPEVPDLTGTYAITDFITPELLAAYQAGQPVIANDITTEPGTLPSVDRYQPFAIRAFASVPCLHQGRWVAALAVNISTARRWRPDEIALLQQVVSRLWSMIEHTRTVQELRRSEAEFRHLANAMPQIVWVTDGEGRKEFINDRWTEYTGLSLAQSVDLQSQTHIIPAEDLQQMQAEFAIAVETKSAYSSEFRLIQPDGTYRYFLVRATPVQDEQGRLLKWYGTSTDVTELKQLEIERVELLRQEQAARATAEQANRIKDEFLAVLSHELRSPLNPILGWSKLLQSGKLSPAKTQQALETIERNAKLQSELIEDLLDVSRILQGKLSLSVSPINLASTIQAAIETVRLSAEAKSILLAVNLNPEVGQVSGDATRLQQVVWNLLANAIKFTPAGGRVEVKLEPVDQQAQIIVSDSGKGIPAHFLPHVFDYFRQEDGATTRKFGGLGLGLAIVRHLVELHGGTIQVESPGEGLGATFRVKLPLMPVQTRLDLDHSSAPSGLNLRGVQVLVIDDETDSREFVAFVLEQAGASVTTASTAGAGFLALTQSPPDVLLSDIGMPDLDGYMLMQQIRALPPEQGGQIPAIALTAYAGEINYQQAITAGFQQHISKPVEPETLVQAISQLLQHRTAP